MTCRPRHCRVSCAEENSRLAFAVLNAYPCVPFESVRYENGAVEFQIDAGALPKGDAGCMELVIRRNVERALALHEAPP